MHSSLSLIRTYHDALGPLTWRDPRRLGFMAMALGAVCMGAGITFSVPMTHVGFCALLGGALLSGAPFYRLSGFPLALLFGVGVLSTDALSPYRQGLDGIPGLAYTWLALYVLPFALIDARVRRWCLGSILIGVGIASLLAVAQFLIGYVPDAPPFRLGRNGEHGLRASGWFSHHIRFGFMMAWAGTIVVCMLRWPDTGPGWRSWTARGRYLGAIAAVLGVVLSSSRGMLLALVVGVATAAAAGWGRARSAMLVGLVLVVGSAGLVGVFAAAFPERTRAMMHGDDVRIQVWHHALSVIHRHPLTGVGAGKFNRAIADLPQAQPEPWHWHPGHAHNSFLSIAVQYGLPVLGLFLAWLIVVVRTLIRCGPASGDAVRLAVAALAVTFIGSLTEDLMNLAIPRYALYFALALALACAAGGIAKPHAPRIPPARE